jgi:hypothetical protein
VYLGQRLAEHRDLGGSGTGGQLHHRVLVFLQHAQPAGGQVADDGPQVRRVHDPGGVGGGELGEGDQVHRHPGHRGGVAGGAAQDAHRERPHRGAARGRGQLPGALSGDQHLRLGGLQHRDRVLQHCRGVVDGQHQRARGQALRLFHDRDGGAFDISLSKHRPPTLLGFRTPYPQGI